MEHHLDDTAVRDHQDVGVRMSLHDVVDRRRNSGFEDGRALAPGHHVPVRLLDPRSPRLGKTLGDLGGRQPFPVAEEDLAERRLRSRRLPDRRADRFSGLECPPEVARIETGEAPWGQPPPQELRLTQAFKRQRGVELALDAVLVVPGGLAVANQNQARGGGFGV